MTKGFLGLKKSNNRGQMAVESVLLMTVLVGAFLALSNTIKQKNLISNLVAKPIKNVAAMTAYGTWKSNGCVSPGKPSQSIGKCHPNAIARSLSSDPKP